jgi:hypothetical protein
LATALVNISPALQGMVVLRGMIDVHQAAKGLDAE